MALSLHSMSIVMLSSPNALSVLALLKARLMSTFHENVLCEPGSVLLKAVNSQLFICNGQGSVKC